LYIHSFPTRRSSDLSSNGKPIPADGSKVSTVQSPARQCPRPHSQRGHAEFRAGCSAPTQLSFSVLVRTKSVRKTRARRESAGTRSEEHTSELQSPDH